MNIDARHHMPWFGRLERIRPRFLSGQYCFTLWIYLASGSFLFVPVGLPVCTCTFVLCLRPCVCVYTYLCTCLCVCMRANMLVYEFVYLWMCTSVCACELVCMWVCVLVHTCICVPFEETLFHLQNKWYNEMWVRFTIETYSIKATMLMKWN